ncbi:hypothetical protein HOG21_00655 [bacterium]|nr:hypothetical protein [bacterium]
MIILNQFSLLAFKLSNKLNTSFHISVKSIECSASLVAFLIHFNIRLEFVFFSFISIL